MSLNSVMKQESALLLSTYNCHPILLVKGKGVFVYDDQGRKYLDFLSGIGVNALGYGHPAIRKAMARQSARLTHVSNLFFHDYQAELAARLTEISGLQRAFFCNSGTEAWEAALKIARAYSRMSNHNGNRPKWRILAMENSFHGRTLGSLATTGQAKYREPFEPLVPGVEFVRFNDLKHLRQQFDSSVCAIALEVVQGEAGIRPVTAEFLAEARALTRKSGALLVVDEVQSGLGRTGKYFAYQHYGVRPDIVTVAKPLAGGLPLGAVLTTEKVSHCLTPGMHGSTFGGGPLACAVAIAFLEALKQERLVEAAADLGAYFKRRLFELQSFHISIREVRALGLMVGVELDSAERAKQVVNRMMQQGIIINRTQETVLRFLPPFVITRKHTDQVVDLLDHLLGEDVVIAGTNPAKAKPAKKITRQRPSRKAVPWENRRIPKFKKKLKGVNHR